MVQWFSSGLTTTAALLTLHSFIIDVAHTPLHTRLYTRVAMFSPTSLCLQILYCAFIHSFVLTPTRLLCSHPCTAFPLTSSHPHATVFSLPPLCFHSTYSATLTYSPLPSHTHLLSPALPHSLTLPALTCQTHRVVTLTVAVVAASCIALCCKDS